MYSKNTTIEIELLRNADSEEKIAEYSKKILSHNKNVALAYDALAKISMTNGKYENMIENKQKAIEVAKYNKYEYTDYYKLLREAIENMGDCYARNKCIECIRQLPELMQKTLDESDPLAWKINDKPKLELEKDALDYINNIR